MATDVMAGVHRHMDPYFLALSRNRRRKFDDAIEICTGILSENPYDQAVWHTKASALTSLNYLDDTELEESGVADLLMDDNAMASMPRPGTSLSRPMTKSNGGGMRPMTQSGRPVTGFARPGTSSRPMSGMSVEGAFKGARPGTSRPATTLGRQVRLGTASMNADAGGFINTDRLDLRRYASRPAVAKVLVDFILYHDHAPRVALDLASIATQAAEYKDWWWKARLGKCYYQLGLLRDAEKQFLSSLREQEMIITYLELCKVYLRLDQPITALDTYRKGADSFPGDVSLLLGIARVHDMLNDSEKATAAYKKVLQVDAANVEAIACLASNHFYTDQPEVALRYYRRLLQMGVSNTELWCNIGLCCFYAAQYDMTLSCFSRALSSASDDNMADVWYNIGMIGIGIGDLSLAYQAFKVAVSIDGNHAEAYNNLGVLELRKTNANQAKLNFQTASSLADYLFEPVFNSALLSFEGGNFQEAFSKVSDSLAICEGHEDSMELQTQLSAHFKAL